MRGGMVVEITEYDTLIGPIQPTVAIDKFEPKYYYVALQATCSSWKSSSWETPFLLSASVLDGRGVVSCIWVLMLSTEIITSR